MQSIASYKITFVLPKYDSVDTLFFYSKGLNGGLGVFCSACIDISCTSLHIIDIKNRENKYKVLF